jgi:response regulator RpfG family c-di-GMP phosphodiesterase
LPVLLEELNSMTNDNEKTILCVDDEENILSAVKRLLRKEDYRVLTASNGSEGLDLLKEQKVQVVISDQRMPGMNGTEFLAKVREQYPDVMRIVLTGYTDVDSITESINKGHIYKFFLKPWNDENLKLEIRQALDQYDLIQANRSLSSMVLEQNEMLKRMNEDLEALVRERTETLEIQNRALELSRAILEHLPLPVIGVSSEGMVVLINQQVHCLAAPNGWIAVGKGVAECFSEEVEKTANAVFSADKSQFLEHYPLFEEKYDIEMVPLKGSFQGNGLLMTLKQVKETGWKGIG